MLFDKSVSDIPKLYIEQKIEKHCENKDCQICKLLIGKIPLSSQNFPSSLISGTSVTASEVVNNVFYIDLTDQLF